MSSNLNGGQDILDEKIPPAHHDHRKTSLGQQEHGSLADKDVHNRSTRTGPSALSCLDPIADIEKQPVDCHHETCPGHTNVLTSITTSSSSQRQTNGGELVPQVSIDVYGNTYPEGGLHAWLVVFGAFSGMTTGFGLMNTVGTFQAYLSTHQLATQSPSTIGWIFSLYTFLAFFCGIQIGPIFDAKGPRALVIAGTVCLVGGTLGVAESTEFWHFVLSFSLAAGLGTALIFTPAVSSVAHFFLIKRAAATGIATTGGSIGGIVFPLMLQNLFPKVGFKWATRILALIFLFQLIVANILIRSRLPRPSKDSMASSIWPDWKIYKNVTFCLTTAGTFFMEWALFVPLSYLTSYALSRGFSEPFSYQILAILNAGSFFGRWIPNYIADKVGRYNTMIITIAMCMTSVLCLWLTCSFSANETAQLIIFALIFGFASGSNISLVPVCVGQLCSTEVFGRWYAGLYTIVSFGCLTGIPVAGAILDHGGGYSGLIVFVGVCYALSLACYLCARVGEVGWGFRERF